MYSTFFAQLLKTCSSTLNDRLSVAATLDEHNLISHESLVLCHQFHFLSQPLVP